jgi:hypothetical protein
MPNVDIMAQIRDKLSAQIKNKPFPIRTYSHCVQIVYERMVRAAVHSGEERVYFS